MPINTFLTSTVQRFSSNTKEKYQVFVKIEVRTRLCLVWIRRARVGIKMHSKWKWSGGAHLRLCKLLIWNRYKGKLCSSDPNRKSLYSFWATILDIPLSKNILIFKSVTPIFSLQLLLKRVTKLGVSKKDYFNSFIPNTWNVICLLCHSEISLPWSPCPFLYYCKYTFRSQRPMDSHEESLFQIRNTIGRLWQSLPRSNCNYSIFYNPCRPRWPIG